MPENLAVKEPKMRVCTTKRFILISAETCRPPISGVRPKAEGKMSAKEIFFYMSKDPGAIVMLDPSSASLSEEEKQVYDELFSLLKKAALDESDVQKAKNCLEILSTPIGLHHPRAKEAITVFLQARKIPIPEIQKWAELLVEYAAEYAAKELLGQFKDEMDSLPEKTRQLLEKRN
jgi:hypothetical protein